jgi:hypothetical protein
VERRLVRRRVPSAARIGGGSSCRKNAGGTAAVVGVAGVGVGFGVGLRGGTSAQQEDPRCTARHGTARARARARARHGGGGVWMRRQTDRHEGHREPVAAVDVGDGLGLGRPRPRLRSIVSRAAEALTRSDPAVSGRKRPVDRSIPRRPGAAAHCRVRAYSEGGAAGGSCLGRLRRGRRGADVGVLVGRAHLALDRGEEDVAA